MDPDRSLMIVGGQWGDEGKGKVVDLLTPAFDVVARYQGGHNAGHTVKFGDQHFALRLVPSGICRPGVVNVIGNGLVIDARALLSEIDGLRASGVTVEENLKVATFARKDDPAVKKDYDRVYGLFPQLARRRKQRGENAISLVRRDLEGPE